MHIKAPLLLKRNVTILLNLQEPDGVERAAQGIFCGSANEPVEVMQCILLGGNTCVGPFPQRNKKVMSASRTCDIIPQFLC
jgi:hypothetical protein